MSMKTNNYGRVARFYCIKNIHDNERCKQLNSQSQHVQMRVTISPHRIPELHLWVQCPEGGGANIVKQNSNNLITIKCILFNAFNTITQRNHKPLNDTSTNRYAHHTSHTIVTKSSTPPLCISVLFARGQLFRDRQTEHRMMKFLRTNQLTRKRGWYGLICGWVKGTGL